MSQLKAAFFVNCLRLFSHFYFLIWWQGFLTASKPFLEIKQYREKIEGSQMIRRQTRNVVDVYLVCPFMVFGVRQQWEGELFSSWFTFKHMLHLVNQFRSAGVDWNVVISQSSRHWRRHQNWLTGGGGLIEESERFRCVHCMDDLDLLRCDFQLCCRCSFSPTLSLSPHCARPQHKSPSQPQKKKNPGKWSVWMVMPAESRHALRSLHIKTQQRWNGRGGENILKNPFDWDINNCSWLESTFKRSSAGWSYFSEADFGSRPLEEPTAEDERR